MEKDTRWEFVVPSDASVGPDYVRLPSGGKAKVVRDVLLTSGLSKISREADLVTLTFVDGTSKVLSVKDFFPPILPGREGKPVLERHPYVDHTAMVVARSYLHKLKKLNSSDCKQGGK